MIAANDWSDKELLGLNAQGPGLDLSKLITRRLPWLLLTPIVCMGLGYLFCIQADPVYQSSAQVLIIKKEATIPSNSASDQVTADESQPDDSIIATQMVLIQSPLLIKKAIENGNLASLPTLVGANSAVQEIVKGLDVKRGGGNASTRDANVLTLTFTAANPNDSAPVLNSIIDAYREFAGDTFLQGSQKTIKLIAQAKDELQKQLFAKEAAYIEFRQNSPNLDDPHDPSRTNVHDQRLAQIAQARAALEVRRAETTAHVKSVRDAIANGDNLDALQLMVTRSQDEASKSLAQAESQRDKEMLQLRLEEQALLEDVGPDHPSVMSVRKRIAMLQEHFPNSHYLGNVDTRNKVSQEFFKVYLDSRQQELTELAKRENELAEAFARTQRVAEVAATQHRREAEKLMIYKLKDQSLRDDQDRTKQLFDSVLKGLQEISLVKDYGGFNSLVLAEAGPGVLVYPRLSLILIVTGSIGLLFGGACGYVLELTDSSYHNPREIEHQLGAPVISHIPSFQFGAHNGTVGGAMQTAAIESTVCTWRHPESFAAENYRTISNFLCFAAHSKGRKVIQITSPEARDGKTTLVANLGVAMALSGKKVLMVDGDSRQQSLHKLFSMESHSNIELQRRASGTRLDDVVHPTAIEDLFLMSASDTSGRCGQWLASQHFQDLVDSARDEFDYVLIDTPPLLAVSAPATVAPRVDGTLLILRLNRDTRIKAGRAVELLKSLGADVVGLVVNAVGGTGRYEYVQMIPDKPDVPQKSS